jgi:3-isopropylmalate/(R)-2-methylmalate dehydratase small subunit
LKFKARVWKFPDDINTDLILPSASFYLTPEEQTRFVFQANRPGWVDRVQPGDIIVGGRNFGMGSSRPGARSLKNLGLGCLLADSINGLFFRNCINFAFPAMSCAGVSEAFDEGDVAEVDFTSGIVRNATTRATLHASVLPPKLLSLLEAGGIYPLLERQGIIAALASARASPLNEQKETHGFPP